MARPLLVLILAVLSTSVNCTLYEHTGAEIDVNVGKETVINLGQKFRYVGRHFFNITLVPRWGCVSFGVLPENLDSVITFENLQEYELVCPLFSQHAGEPTEDYKFMFEEFDNTSTLAEEIERDINEVSQIFVDYTPKVKRGVLVTWINATRKTGEGSGFASTEEEVSISLESERNTYQVAIVLVSAEDVVENAGAVRPDYTFAVFNYDQVQWTGWTARNDSNLRGLAGMVYGDNKGVQSLPFARNEDEIKTYLPKKSSIVGIEGRYIYDITELPQRHGCLDVLDFPPTYDQPELLSISVRTADIFGGTIVRIQGQCRPGEGYPPVRCGFADVNEDDEPYWKTEIGVYLSNYTIVCLTPRLELGSSKIGLSSPPPFKDYPFQADFYVNAPTADTALLQINNNFDKNYLEENAEGQITLTWNPELFGRDQKHRFEIFIEAFKQNDFSTIVTRTFKLGETATDSGSFSFNISDTQCQGLVSDECEGFLIGYFNLRIKDFSDAPINPYTTKRVAISSIPIPIGWFVRSYHRSKYGNSWYYRYCKNPQRPLESPKCPCSKALAQYDTRQFSPAPDCERNDRGGRCMLQADDSYCYNALSNVITGLRCCYNRAGDLIYGTDDAVVGSHKLTYFPFANFRTFGIPGARTYLSYYLTHVKNHYACCSAQGVKSVKTSYCAAFARNAAAPARCTDHQPSSITAIVGDPHFVLPDNQTYSFNGVGEFWYAYSSDYDLVKIQIRLAKATSKFVEEQPYQVKAAILKAVALKYQDTVIQVQVQPLTYLNDQTASTKRLMVIINGREETWTNDEQIRFYEGFRIASSGDNQDKFHVTLLDGGAMVACDYIDNAGDAEGPISPGAMNCRVSYSQLQRDELSGLIGVNVDGNYELQNRANQSAADLLDPLDVHQKALTWQVSKAESFLRYIDTTWEKVNSETNSFVPEFKPSLITGTESDEISVCGSKDQTFFDQCSYDFRSTGSKVLAAQTQTHLAETAGIFNQLNVEQTFCPAQDLPFATVHLSNGNKFGSVANVTGCVRNYIPKESTAFPVIRKCEKQGSAYVWTGPTVECIRGALYDTLTAKTLANPYKDANSIDLGIKGFSAVYLGRRVTDLRVSILKGCVVLIDTTEAGYEPLICPLVANHAGQPPSGVTDKFKFYYETFNENDLTGTLATISADIREVARNLDFSTSEYGVLNAYMFTWSEATHEGADCSTTELCNNQKRNTYQVTISQGYNGKTYVIFNYEKIEWSGIQSPGLNPTNNSVAGFYYGDLKGVLALPYSGKTTTEIQKLVKGGTLLSQQGRYIFEVSSLQNPRRLGCYQSLDGLKSTELLSISTNVVDIYGGNLIRVQGACFDKTVTYKCGFERRSSGTFEWVLTPLHQLDFYTGLCEAPKLPEIDVGWRAIAVTNGTDATFQNRVYFGTSRNGGGVYQLDFTSPAGEFWLWTQPNTTVTVTWFGNFGIDDEENPVSLELFIRGYTKDKAVDFDPIAHATTANNSIEFHTSLTQCNHPDCEGILIGQFVLRVNSTYLESVYDKSDINRASLTSVLMPVGWFTNKHHTDSRKTTAWYNQFCDASPVPIATTSLPECPCTENLAKTEERLFFITPDCLGYPSSINNCMFSPAAGNCYTTLPTKKGYSIRCCYDKGGYLIQSQSSPLEGSFVLSDAVNSNSELFGVPGANTQLSYQLSHVKNYFACCSVNILQNKVLPKNCTDLIYNRATSRSCGGFRYSGWSAVVGEPHFVTLDNSKYTFNGVGEYWYVYSSSASFDTKIQVRLVKAVDKEAYYVNASTLKAIAFEFQGSKVEIHVQPYSFRAVGYNNRYLMILVDGKEQFWSGLDEQFHPKFKITTDINQFQVTVVAQDNGPLIECQFIDADAFKIYDGMNCRLSLPNAYKRQTNGLSGYWDDDSSTDLTARDSQIWSPIIVDPKNMLAVHKNFSLSWRVKESETLFTYFDDSWNKFNEEVDSFIPELKFPPNYGIIGQDNITRACGAVGNANRDQCQYDMELTGSGTFAQKTLTYLNKMDTLRSNLEKITVASCDYLDIPFATVTFPTGTVVGSTAQVTACLPGYNKVEDTFPTFVCTQVGQNAPSWSPAPRTVCRGEEKLYGDLIGAIKLDPSNFTLPSYTLPEQFNRATQGIMYGGRKIDGFSWLADIGCIALAQNVSDSSSLRNLNENRGTDIPLLCPFLASHTKKIDVSGKYQLLFKQLTYPSVYLSEITRDIQAVSDGLDTMLGDLEVTNAYVFTWKDALSASSTCDDATSCNAAARNNYEAVLAVTNKQTSYVLYSYQNITWSKFVDDESYAGFHLGDNKGTVKLPFAGTTLDTIKQLTTTGTIRGFNGRYVYRVTDRIERLGCLSLSAYTERQPLTMNTYVADIYGGRRLVLQAACVADSISNWECLFSKNPFLPSGWTAKTAAVRLNAYSVVCLPPALPHVDVGEFFVGLSTGDVTAWRFDAKIYFAGTVSGSMPVRLTDNLIWFTAEVNQDLRVEWSPEEFPNRQDNVKVLLRTFKQKESGVFDSLDYPIGTATASEGVIAFNPSDAVCDSECEGRLIGQVVVRLINTSALLDSSLQNVEISSTIVPIGWYVNKWHKDKFGREWYNNYCEVKPSTPSLHCPCTATLAEEDFRTFTSAPNCNDVFGSECLITSQADKCFTTLPQSESGAGLLCCYDRSDNLIYPQDKPFGGSFELQYTPTASDSLFGVTGATGYLSYHNTHSKNLFACCSANLSTVASARCYDYVESRSPHKKCYDYTASGVSATIGDPHLLTADGTVYTFNGVGEYWWVFGDTTGTKGVRVQARFRNGFKTSVAGTTQTEIKASLLSAIAITYDTTEIEIEVQSPLALAGGSRKLTLSVEQIERQFGSSLNVMYYLGARIASSATQDSIQITLPFNGPSIQCGYTEVYTNPTVGAMSCTILLPQTYKNKVFGLVGKWDGNATNDLINRANIEAGTPSTNASDLAAVHDFGRTWRVLSNETKFTYFSSSFEEVNQNIDKFVPELTLKPSSPISQQDIDLACGRGAQFAERCEYDYRVTLSRTVAQRTGSGLRGAFGLQLSLASPVTNFCPLLDIPYAAKSYTNGLKQNSIATVVSCVSGYTLNPTRPRQYTCTKTGNVIDWSPTPLATTCIAAAQTTTTLATSPPASSSAAPSSAAATTVTSTPSSSSSAVPLNEDHTAEIILGVFMGVFILITFGLIAYYFVSIKPKLKVTTANNTQPVTMEMGYPRTEPVPQPRAPKPVDDTAARSSNLYGNTNEASDL